MYLYLYYNSADYHTIFGEYISDSVIVIYYSELASVFGICFIYALRD